MYLNRRIYLVCKGVSAFCFGLFGYICCLMTLGLIMDIMKGEGIYLNEAIMKPYIIILCMTAGFYYLKFMIERAKLYDSFLQKIWMASCIRMFCQKPSAYRKKG